MKKTLACLCAAAALLGVSGCANLQPAKYTMQPETVQTLKELGAAKVRMGEFRANKPDAETADISMRGAGFSSPYGSFAIYLREAIQQEFAEAGRISPDANTEISGVLMKNLLNAAISTGEGELSARITVRRSGTIAYDRQLTARITWESSFAGAVAIPKAQTEYPRLVQEFVRTLVRDSDFILATK